MWLLQQQEFGLSQLQRRRLVAQQVKDTLFADAAGSAGALLGIGMTLLGVVSLIKNHRIKKY